MEEIVVPIIPIYLSFFSSKQYSIQQFQKSHMEVSHNHKTVDTKDDWFVKASREVYLQHKSGEDLAVNELRKRQAEDKRVTLQKYSYTSIVLYGIN